MRTVIALLVLFFAQANIYADVESDKAAGTQALSNSKFEQAAEIFAAALKEQPEDGEAHFRLGMALMELNRLEEAETQFTLAGEDGFQALRLSGSISLI